eukprot:m.257285 g.257285  ORF g.257285 m.257285 type:complete len:222 (+) comp35148_c0_seq1:265-930(+)
MSISARFALNKMITNTLRLNQASIQRCCQPTLQLSRNIRSFNTLGRKAQNMLVKNPPFRVRRWMTTGEKASEVAVSNTVNAQQASYRMVGKGQIFLHTPTLGDKIVLVGSLKFLPHQIPEQIGLGVLNTAYSRFRILSSLVVWCVLLYYVEMAIRSGRLARDGGEQTIFKDKASLEVQEAKRRSNPEPALEHGGIVETYSNLLGKTAMVTDHEIIKKSTDA